MKRSAITVPLFLGLLFGRPKAAIADIVGFVYTGGVFTLIPGYPGATSTSIGGINDSGQVVGFAAIPPSGSFNVNGYVYAGGVYTTINDPGFNGTAATGINNLGQIVGLAVINGTVQNSFLDSGGTFTTISDPGTQYTEAYGINDSGQIVGFAGGNTGPIGFVDTGGIFTTLNYPGATYTLLLGINDSGQIVGRYIIVTGNQEVGYGFLYSGGVFTAINYPGATATEVVGINESGQIVGDFADNLGNHGFVYSAGIFTELNYPGTNSYTVLAGINDGGQMVGYAQVQGGTAPEPTYYGILAVGMAGLLLASRRRNTHEQGTHYPRIPSSFVDGWTSETDSSPNGSRAPGVRSSVQDQARRLRPNDRRGLRAEVERL